MTVFDENDPESIRQNATYARTTPRFTNESVPSALLGDHKVSTGAWAIVVVLDGQLDFVFQDPREVIHLSAGDLQVIPPERLHHLVLDGPTIFEIEFYRSPASQG